MLREQVPARRRARPGTASTRGTSATGRSSTSTTTGRPIPASSSCATCAARSTTSSGSPTRATTTRTASAPSAYLTDVNGVTFANLLPLTEPRPSRPSKYTIMRVDLDGAKLKLRNLDPEFFKGKPFDSLRRAAQDRGRQPAEREDVQGQPAVRDERELKTSRVPTSAKVRQEMQRQFCSFCSAPLGRLVLQVRSSIHLALQVTLQPRRQVRRRRAGLAGEERLHVDRLAERDRGAAPAAGLRLRRRRGPPRTSRSSRPCARAMGFCAR